MGKQQIQLLQQVTTYTLSRVLQSCCKVNNKIQDFAGTISRAMRVQGEALFIVVSLAATLDLKEPRRGECPGEALFIVVKVVQVVFPCVHVESTFDVPAKRCYLL